MPGEKNLAILLKSLNPILLSETYVFCLLPGGRYGDLQNSEPIASFMEEEGLSLVLTKTQAERQKLSYVGEYRAISLKVFSSLDAVGMTAAISAKLTQYNISANVIAAFNHDHVFVNAQDADEAFALLANFS
ncbi:MAG: hypothetical protein ACI9FB_000931 [Candidatus Azotimanducaceae bacterium]|jgi:hypothetical protein